MNSSSTRPRQVSGRSRGRPPNPELRTVKHQRMLKAAMELFVDRGYEHVTVEEIARAAGQSKGAFYWYFKDKEDCLVQIVQAYAQLMSQALTKAASNASGSASSRLLAITDFRPWSDQDFRRFVMLINSMYHSRSPSVRELAVSLSGQWTSNGFNLVKQLMKEASREAGWTAEKIASFDYDAWTFIYISCFNGIYTQLHRGYLTPEPSADRIAEAIHNSFVRPLAKPAAEETNRKHSAG